MSPGGRGRRGGSKVKNPARGQQSAPASAQGGAVRAARDQTAGQAGSDVTTCPPSVAWQRPPFEPGNTLAVTHGANSPRAVEARAQQLVADVAALDPVWLAAVDAAAVQAWAWAEARCQLYRGWLAGRDLVQEDGEPWPAEIALQRWERRAADARSALGFDPLSRSRLTKDTAIARAAAASGLAAVEQAGRRAVAGTDDEGDR